MSTSLTREMRIGFFFSFSAEVAGADCSTGEFRRIDLGYKLFDEIETLFLDAEGLPNVCVTDALRYQLFDCGDIFFKGTASRGRVDF
ncbi:hypothetical protein GOA57_32290 [Sinorhizobium meliloti]|nr:hypothetical protein [Sinorhizobium meliloti]